MKRRITAGGSGVITRIPQHMRDAALGNYNPAFAMDAAAGAGMAFLESELEKRDPKVREPLTSVTWMRDIVARTGGGWVEFTSQFFVDYQTTGPNMYGLMGGQTNNVPTMQADIRKDAYPVVNWGNVNKVTFIDLKKTQNIGRALDEILDKGIRLNYNKAIDYVVYVGFGSSYGLVNDTAVTNTAAAAGASGSTIWINKTPDEILYDINTVLVNTWSASQYDVTGMADYILVPPSQYAQLTRPMTVGGFESIMAYVLKNNIAVGQGRDLQILPSRWCIGANNGGPNGDSSFTYTTLGGGDRMVGYVNEEDKVHFDITVPINRALTQPSVLDQAYLTLYLAQIGVVKKLYTQPFLYIDGI